MDILSFTITSEMKLIALSVNFILIAILFLMNISNRLRLKNLREKYNKFMNGISDRNMEELLEDCIDRVNEVKSKNKEIETHINAIERNLLQSVQKIGIVRFNAFENVGSDLSFSIALMDSNDDGVVISGIYARDSSSTYAKPVTSGISKYPLSAEEMQAIDIAKKTHKEKLYLDKKV